MRAPSDEHQFENRSENIISAESGAKYFPRSLFRSGQNENVNIDFTQRHEIPEPRERKRFNVNCHLISVQIFEAIMRILFYLVLIRWPIRTEYVRV